MDVNKSLKPGTPVSRPLSPGRLQITYLFYSIVHGKSFALYDEILSFLL